MAKAYHMSETQHIFEEDDVVQRYCHETKELAKSQLSKAHKFVQHDCVHYLGFDLGAKEEIFTCLPLNTSDTWKVNHTLQTSKFPDVYILNKKPFAKDYNSSAYKMRFSRTSNKWSCDCQGWISKSRKGEMPESGIGCSHLHALMIHLERLN